VIVCGCSHLGFRITEQLHLAGMGVLMVDDAVRPAMRASLQRWGVPVLADGSRSPEMLAEAGLDGAIALVAAHDVDLFNLELALAAADLAPDVRLVVRADNAQLRDQLSAALPSARLLGLAGNAGPSVVEACIAADVLHAFRTGGELFAVLDAQVGVVGTCRGVFGDLTPVALRRPGDGMDVCPGRDTAVRPGDHVALLGRPDDFGPGQAVPALGAAAAELADLHSARLPEPQPTRRGRRIRGVLATAVAELSGPFRLALLAMATIMVVSTVLLGLTYRANNPAAPADFDMLDAWYLTVETMVTVGYGDYNFGQADHWLQLYGIGLMLAGALSIAVIYAFITNIIISRRLERTLGKGAAGAARDHVIICGLGSVGLTTVEGLVAAGREVVVIERNEHNRFLPVMRELDVPVVLGDATVRQTLLDAGLPRAATLAALTSDDVANVEAVLSAREAYADLPGADADQLRVVLRMFDTVLADGVERRFDIHRVVSASALATPWFVGAALGYDVVSTFYVERTPFVITRMTVAEGGGLHGPTLRELTTGTRILSVTPAGPAADGGPSVPDYRPTRHTRLGPGDELLVVGPYVEVIDTVRVNRTRVPD
jgi:Trk K+ transport system NAD-binding subunit